MSKLLSMLLMMVATLCVQAASMGQSAETSFPDANEIPLIPYPASLIRSEGTFDLSRLETVVTEETKETLAPSAYELSITPDAIVMRASDDAGFFYARMTLRQLQETSKNGTIPCIEIADAPRFQHRGYMLDVARHFFTKENVKEVLDIMAMYKLNVFHWHLTDDQGWRIEIPEYPKLTEVGAVRDKSLTTFGLGTKFYDDTEYGRGCYFTLDDLREIVAYAAERHITIIPEVDMPGHMVAAIASYPELSCNPSKTYSVRSDSGISTDVLDISNPEVIKFLKCVLGHVAEVFPGKLIHIGGDECPTENWQASASCQAFAKEKGLTINQLQGWLVEELGEWLRDNYGKDIVVWDELLDRWPDTNEIKPVVMAWNNISKSATAANRGMKSIISPHQQMYLDFMQAAPANCDVNEGYFGGWSETNINTLDEIYNLNPTASLAGKEEYCLGPQGNMWCETCCDFSQVLYQLLPRGLALAEIGWTPNENKNWSHFLARLQSHDEVFDAHGWSYGKHFFDQSDVPAAQTALKEAREILAATKPGCAGYVSQEVYDALKDATDVFAAAVEGGNDTPEQLEAFNSQLTAFKQADIIQPDPNKIYQVISASTYYKAKYDGSSLYAIDGKVRFHYTPQLEPEEIWTFEEGASGSFYMRNLLADSRLHLQSLSNVTILSTNGTAIVVKKATKANGNYTYVPGSVLISKKSSSSSMLFADVTGFAKTASDSKLCCQSTWRLQEVSDYSLLLDRLVNKAETIILKRADGREGTPSNKALEYLQTELIDAALAETDVDAEVYAHYVDVYAEYIAMPRMSFIDTLDEGVYYRIRNAYSGWSHIYAVLNDNGFVAPSTDITTDGSLWQISKQGGSKVLLINKADNKQAYVSSAEADQYVKTTTRGTVWSLSEYASEESEGILIQTGDFSWYTNPNAWTNNILLKPIAWGASVWVFEPTNVPTGISAPKATNKPARWYDLQGRPANGRSHGILISSDGRKIIY